ncbi:MAG: MFS transporter, partial [Patescibacteria group bacterium]
ALRVILPLSFCLSVAFALPMYIESSFLATMVSATMVSWYFVIAMAAGLIAMNLYPWFITRFTNYRTALVTMTVCAASLLGLSLVTNRWWALVWFVFLTISQYLLIINLDLFIERFTATAMTGRIRTTYYTVVSLGVIVSPLVVGQLIGWSGGYSLVFLVAALWVIPVMVLLMLSRRQLQDHIHYRHHHLLTTLRHVVQRADIRRIFGVSLLLELFYAMAVIYMPIYLTTVVGFSWQDIGVAFTIMIVPFVVLELPAGIVADRYFGERGMMIIGFLILSSTVLVWSLINSSSLLVWVILLFLSRCGAALVEAMRETYFFKIVNVADVDYINFFRNTKPLAWLSAAAIAGVVLRWFDLSTLFFGLGLILIFGVWFASGLRDTSPIERG